MKLSLDFSKVEDKGAVAEGKYVAVVEEITKEDGASGYPYLKWNLKITKGGSVGMHITHITSLKPEALFNLRNTLEALGFSVPKSAVSLDIGKCMGKPIGIEVTMRKANDGNEYPNVKKVFKADTYAPASGADMAMSGSASEDDDELELPFK